MTDFYNGRIGFDVAKIVIPNGSNVSTPVQLNGFGMVSLTMPESFNGTSCTFTASNDGITYLPLYNTSGILLATTVAVSIIVLYSPGDFVGIKWLKYIASEIQIADRSLLIGIRSFQ